MTAIVVKGLARCPLFRTILDLHKVIDRILLLFSYWNLPDLQWWLCDLPPLLFVRIFNVRDCHEDITGHVEGVLLQCLLIIERLHIWGSLFLVALKSK